MNEQAQKTKLYFLVEVAKVTEHEGHKHEEPEVSTYSIFPYLHNMYLETNNLVLNEEEVRFRAKVYEAFSKENVLTKDEFEKFKSIFLNSNVDYSKVFNKLSYLITAPKLFDYLHNLSFE